MGTYFPGGDLNSFPTYSTARNSRILLMVQNFNMSSWLMSIRFTLAAPMGGGEKLCLSRALSPSGS